MLIFIVFIHIALHLQSLQAMMEQWVTKYDKDTFQKQKELDLLKQTRARDQEKRIELTRTVSGTIHVKYPSIISIIVYLTIIFTLTCSSKPHVA